MTIPSPSTVAVAQRLTAADWNLEVRDTQDWMLGNTTRPACQVYNSADISLTTGSTVLMTYDTETYDTDAMHSTSSNTSRVILTETGLYEIKWYVRFSSNATGYREINLRLNAAGASGGGTSLKTHSIGAANGAATSVAVAIERRFTAADYVELFAQQNSGSTLQAQTGNNVTGITARWLMT